MKQCFVVHGFLFCSVFVFQFLLCIKVDQLYVTEAPLLYLLVSNRETTPNRIFVEYHNIVEFCSEVKRYENVFSLRPKSLSAVTKKIQEIKGKLKVDKELFKTQIQNNWFFE